MNMCPTSWRSGPSATASTEASVPATPTAMAPDQANLQGIANDMWARLDQDFCDSGYTAEMTAQQKARFNHLIAAAGVQVE